MITFKFIMQLAGAGQIALAMGSIAIPKILAWQQELGKVKPFIKQLFWTYASYIFVINICFGLVSLLCASDILGHTRLSLLVSGFIAAYWISRVSIQFFYFDREGFPKGFIYTLAETALVTLFISLSLVYSYSFYLNL